MAASLANKIAAGEVVERPRSIVKELVENALDAGASEIKVRLSQAGIQNITVIDNGTGMSEADASLAFIRHATSKIFAERDLFSIHTLGFRGEALAAIAAVSKIRLLTGLVGKQATEIMVEAGEIVSQTSVDSRIGTSIEVSNVFYNTPARLKHLKSVQTEYTHTLEYLQKMALARPEIRFELIHDGKMVFKTYGTGDLAQTLVMIYGEKVAPYLFHVEAQNDDFNVRGIITHPQIQRSHNRVLNLTINGRAIRHFGLNHAILRGYGKLLPKGMFPIVALDVSLDVRLVDVNVHPAKLEVRISEEQTLQTLVEEMVKATLMRENLIYQDVSKPVAIQTSEQLDFQQSTSHMQARNGQKGVRKVTKGDNLSKPETTLTSTLYDLPTPSIGQQVLRETPKATDMYTTRGRGVRTSESLDGSVEMGRGAQPEVSVKTEASADNPMHSYAETAQVTIKNVPTFEAARLELRALEVIGQFDGTYILAQTNNTLFVIDQHAAQERIRYDAHVEQTRRKERIVSQQLLLPFTLFLERREMDTLMAFKSELTHYGLEFETFSTNEIRINSVPSWIMQENIETYVRRTIDCVLRYRQVDEADIREKELIMLSCRYSIKAHDVLSKAEMQALLEQLSTTTTPFTCPHGRPTVIKQKLYEVEKWFKRV